MVSLHTTTEEKKFIPNYKSQPIYRDTTYQKRKNMRQTIQKKNAARTRFLILFFLIMGILIPKMFFDTANILFLNNFKNSKVKTTITPSFFNAAETSIINGGDFLDTKYLNRVNPNNKLMKSLTLTRHMPNITRKLKNLASSYPNITPGIFVWDYNTGQYVDINSEKVFSTASIIKIPILYQLFRRVDKGLIDLNDSMSTEKHSIAGGSGNLQYFPVGTTMTYKKLAKLMIQESDNTATNMLLSAVGGMNELNREIKHWGFNKTGMNNWLPDLKGTNISTPEDIAAMLYNIDNSELLTIESRANIVEIMSHVKNSSLIQAGLPNNTEFLHKTGNIKSMLGDAGIVNLPDGRKYIVVMMVERPANSYSANQFMVEASKIISSSYKRHSL